MDYYERKRRGQALIRTMLKNKASKSEIVFAVDDTLQLSKKFVESYLELIGEN